MPTSKSIVVIALTLVIAGCGKPPDEDLPKNYSKEVHVSSSKGFADPEKQARFAKALEAAGIPYSKVRWKDGVETLEWQAKYTAQVDKIERDLFGVAPPSCRSFSEKKKCDCDCDCGETAQKKLRDAGIEYQETQYDGKTWITVASKDRAKVADLGPQYRFLLYTSCNDEQ